MANSKESDLAELGRKYDELYATYGKPLESEHRGEFLAISPRGEVLLKATFDEVTEEGVRRFGPGIFVYKVGERAALKWR
jgi:hypothetical protein